MLKQIIATRARVARVARSWSGAMVSLCALLGACQHITDPSLPAGAEAFAPPAVYARWWVETQACSGLTGSFAAVSWFEVPHVSTFLFNGEYVGGYWSLASNRIVLPGEVLLDGGAVRHEMLHALVRVRLHPRAQFLGRCAGVVECGRACVADGGPPPPRDPAARFVPSDSLDIAVAVTPATPGGQMDGGVFTVTVTATNRAPYPVVIVVPLAGRQVSDPAPAFGLDIGGPTGLLSLGTVVLDSSTAAFAAGETKRQLFDFALGNDLGLHQPPPGAYRMRGAYGRHWSEFLSFTLAP